MALECVRTVAFVLRRRYSGGPAAFRRYAAARQQRAS